MLTKRLPLTLIILLLLALAPVTLAQDDGDDDAAPVDPAADLSVILTEDERLSTLNAALEAAGLLPLVQNSGPFTLLAPTNAAFDALLDAEGLDAETLLSDTARLQRILLYHLLPGSLDAATLSDLTEQEVATSLAGATLPITVTDDGLQFGADDATASVADADLSAENGVIHILDAALVPTEEQGSTDTFYAVALGPDDTLASTLAAADEDSELPLTLSALADAAGYTALLSGSGAFTLFAPTNAALQTTADRLGDDVAAILQDEDRARDLLSYHLVPAVFTTTDMLDKARTFLGTALPNRLLTLTVEDEAILINDAPLGTTDIITGNGVIHYIDAVLFPTGDAPEVAADDEATQTFADVIEDTATVGGEDATDSLAQIVGDSDDFSTLLNAVAAAGLAELLDQTGPYTVFAPTDAAFDAYFTAQGLDADVVLSDVELLTQILLYHIVPGRLNAETLAAQADNELMTALPGSTLNVGAETINDIAITTTDISATNGVIHVIDGVLAPAAPDLEALLLATPEDTVLDALSAEEFSLFRNALAVTGLDAALEIGGPYTLFVPTNDALSAFLVRSGLSRAEFLNNPALAQPILLYHIVPYRYQVASLPIGNAASFGTLITGETLLISRDADDPELIFVNEAQVSDDAISTGNGEVYPIDGVLVTGG